MSWTTLLTLAGRRHGVVRKADARAHGVSDDAFHGRANREEWTRLHHGVWLVAGARDDHMVRHVAAVLATDGLAARRSALWLHGLTSEPPYPPQVLVPHARNGVRTPTGIEVARSRTLREEDHTTARGVPTTAVARTLVDIAPHVRDRTLLGMVIDAERTRSLQREQLAARHALLPRGVPGRGRLGRVLQQLEGTRSDSTTEHEIRRTLLDLGYPVHPEPFPFRCDDGVVVHLDLALPASWVHLECDGFGVHTTRRVFETDRVRWNQVVRRWRPVWVTDLRWRRDRAGVLRDLDAALAAADPTRPPAQPWRGALLG